jgi:hypothetical protein
MIQFLIILVGFLGLAHLTSTPEQRETARQDVKKFEPICLAITLIVGGFLLFAWLVG